MTTAGSNNPFPSILIEEVASDGSATGTPAADFRRLFLGEDGLLHLKDSSAVVTDIGGDDPIFDKFGAPTTAYEFDTSSLAGLTALGTATAEDADATVPGHYYLRIATNSNPYFGGRYAAVSQPFTAICKISGDNARQNFHEAGMFIGAASPSAIDTFMHGYAGAGSDRAFHLHHWNSLGSFASNIANGSFVHHGTYWLAIRAASNTSVDYLYSMDGHVWYPLVLARDPSLTLGSVGLLAKSEDTSNGVVVAFDFLRIWNSALTFVR